MANRVGEENDGWRVTMVTLSFERGTAFVGDLLEAIELLSTPRSPWPGAPAPGPTPAPAARPAT